MRRAAFAGTLLLLAVLPAVAADKIHLRGGSVVEGTIESHDAETIVLRSGAETLRIPQRLVDRVELGGRPAAAAAESSAPAGTKAASGAKDATVPTAAPLAAAGAPAATQPVTANAAADAALLAKLAAKDLPARAAAMEAVVTGWPATAGTLDAALGHDDASVRRDAISLLGRRELGDTAARIRASLSDADANARAAAVRQVRIRAVPDTEPVLLRLLASDAVVMVRLEALRTLEEVGTVACLPTVLQAWAAEPAETERDRRRRYLRVLRKLTGEDAGEDRVANAEAWRLAIERAAARPAAERREAGADRAPEAPVPADAPRK